MQKILKNLMIFLILSSCASTPTISTDYDVDWKEIPETPGDKEQFCLYEDEVYKLKARISSCENSK